MDDLDEETRTTCTQIMVHLNIPLPWQSKQSPISFQLFTLNRGKWQEVYIGLALWNAITFLCIIFKKITLFLSKTLTLFNFSFESSVYGSITKTRLFKYTENFTTKNWKFSDKKILIFFKFLLKI